MERETLRQLIAWKEQADRKPLILRGARQTGKTWLMQEFGRTQFKDVVYVNFESMTRFKDLFQADYSPQRIITTLQLYAGKIFQPADTLIIFDEIQAVKGGLTALKYFCEEAPEYAIVAAGSLLGISMHEEQSFPVGKVNFIDLHPMTFHEFLLASGKALLANAIRNEQWDLLQPFHDELMTLLHTYMYVGGMPEVVKKWVESHDYFAVREKQLEILRSYAADFSKHAQTQQVPRLNMVWDSLPAQLSKENKKFVYGVLREGARAKDFELAIMWLYDCGLVLRSNRITVPHLPLKAYQEMSVFKLYMVDTGLLCAATGVDAQILMNKNMIFTEFKGALTEQFVMQELTALHLDYIGYWTNERSTAEVDFLVQHGSDIIPLEIKSGENLRARSFTLFCQNYTPSRAYKISTLPYHNGTPITNLPLYAVSAIKQIGY